MNKWAVYSNNCWFIGGISKESILDSWINGWFIIRVVYGWDIYYCMC